MRRAGSLLFASALAAGFAFACANVAGIADLTVGDCKGGEPCTPVAPDQDTGVTEPPDAGTEDVTLPTPSVDASKPCPSKGGKMIRVGDDEDDFCIDATEVTVASYKQFLAEAGAAATTQPTECTWNTSFEPQDASPALPSGYPQIDIDYCDAVAYCKWAGKRLCGRRVGHKYVGPVTDASPEDYITNEWYFACSAKGSFLYPYGGIPRDTYCNTVERDAGGPVAAGSISTCVGGYPGIFDMSGNVYEWYEETCQQVDGGGHETDDCHVRGGGYTTQLGSANCAVDFTGATRQQGFDFVGVRCCAD